MVVVNEEDYLMHYGILRKSGRYPWGSGQSPHQRSMSFLDMADDLKKSGLSDVDVAKGLGLESTTDLRALRSIAKNQVKMAQQVHAQQLKDKGMSNVAIGKQLGIPESQVRAILAPQAKAKADVLQTTSDFLENRMKEQGGYLDIGAGTEHHIGVSATQLAVAASMLKDKGYEIIKVQENQLGTGLKTNLKILAPEGTTYRDVKQNMDKIGTVAGYSEDGGKSFTKFETPKSIDLDRVAVRYGPDGGASKDGVIELRRGVDDISLRGANYGQVRIAVNGTHYLKGMAMYSDDLPKGVDMVFNTNKSNTGNKLDAMKPIKKDKSTGQNDPDLPFGSIVRQMHYTDKNGKDQLSILNIVGSESPDGDSTSGVEGGWSKWSAKLSSQMLSKQSPALAKKQLGLTYDSTKQEYDEIMSLTNPAVKKKLLQSFADSADSSSVHLKAAGLPRTAAHVILPINSLKDDEVYAPKYRDGEKVVLIRHPHGGTFEIPELTVNNRNKEANSLIKNAADAIGINSKVAERLSGADFDGDTVLVIPNNDRSIKTSKPLKELEGFDPKSSYPKYEGMSVISPRAKQQQMGDVSNLITDMTIKGASTGELARAVKHSMVVIDAEKHELNYKQSALDNGIKDLKAKYQGKSNAGASTLVSRAKSETRVPERKQWTPTKKGSIDPVTGKKVYTETGETYTDKNGKVKLKTTRSSKMAETDDARTLSSGEPIEEVYAEHANKLKALANSARKAYLDTGNIEYSPSARVAYDAQVKTLNHKLNAAQSNAPLERKAQVLANATVKLKTQANPDLDQDALKKIKGQALTEARNRVGAKKPLINITDDEWNAIQAGAITNNKLNSILNNADLDQLKQLAMPREAKVMPASKVSVARNMLNAGLSQAEIADALGVAVSTLNSALLRKD